MPITQVSVSVRRLIALAKYENVTYEASATASVSPGEDPHEVYADTLDFCKDKILVEIDRLSK
jgi:hypothetical protein